MAEDERRSLSVVIPAYNESHRLPRTLAEIRPFLEQTFPSYEVIVVDDGSSDSTPDLVEDAAKSWPNLRLLRQGHNIGKGAAVRRGCLDARCDLVLFMDADHAVPIQELCQLIEDLDRDDCGAVAGVRTYQGHETRWRRVIGLLAQVVAHLIVFDRSVMDSQCGFKLFTRETVDAIFPLCRVNGGMIDVEIFHLMHMHDVSCYFEAVHWNNKPGSRINVLRCMVMDPLDMVGIRLRHTLGVYKRPLTEAQQPWSR